MVNAVSRGLAFLAAQQDEAGFWEDWELPVGASRMWTTAYVGWRLTSSGYPQERAANWMEAAELDGGGWGYAESTGADADSTALGILFLTAMGRPAPESAIRRLLLFVRDDGGFGTYAFDRSFGSWTTSQVEVTATAAMALRAAGVECEAVRRAESYVRSRRRPDGLWDSYWWTSPFYATEVCARFLGDEVAALERLHPANVFEDALRSMALRRANGRITAAQLADGSWPSAPVLRLTRRNVFEPRASDDAGPCFSDPRRMFTTATVVAALSVTHQRG